MNAWNWKYQKALGLAALIVATAAIFAGCKTQQTGGQTATLKIDSGFAQAIATNVATAIQGGTVVDAGLFNGPVMVESAKGQLAASQARVVIGFNFGADAAPNAAALDTETQDLKNDIGRVLEKASGNPYAAAAVAGLQVADKALTPGKPLPLGDRTAGQGYMLFEGESADAKEFGVEAVGAFVDVRAAAHGVPRATSTETRTRTITVTNDSAVVQSLGESYINLLIAQVAAEKQAENPANDRPAPQPDAPGPSPVADGVSDEARAAAWYPNIARGGGNNSAVAAGVGKRFLWKPTSDSNGKAAVHTSNAHYVTKIEIVSGGAVIETANLSAIGNGYRPLFRLAKPGSAYPSGLTVRHLPSGYEVRVANPGERTETDGTPAYAPAKPATPPGTTDPGPTGALYQRTPSSLTLRADLAAVVSRVDAMFKVVEPGNPNPLILSATRSGNTWTLPQPLASYPVGNRPNTWRIRLTGVPPPGVTYHTSIMQTFVREGDPDGAFYPPSTRS